MTLDDCQDALITGCLDHRGGTAFLALEGPQVHGISLQGNSLTGFAQQIRCGPEVPADAVQPPANVPTAGTVSRGVAK